MEVLPLPSPRYLLQFIKEPIQKYKDIAESLGAHRFHSSLHEAETALYSN